MTSETNRLARTKSREGVGEASTARTQKARATGRGHHRQVRRHGQRTSAETEPRPTVRDLEPWRPGFGAVLRSLASLASGGVPKAPALHLFDQAQVGVVLKDVALLAKRLGGDLRDGPSAVEDDRSSQLGSEEHTELASERILPDDPPEPTLEIERPHRAPAPDQVAEGDLAMTTSARPVLRSHPKWHSPTNDRRPPSGSIEVMSIFQEPMSRPKSSSALA
jgi:hypothetical protein